MKTLMIALSLFLTASAHAGSYNYQCFRNLFGGQTTVVPEVQLSVDSNALSYFFLNEEGERPSEVTFEAQLAAKQSSNPAYRRYQVTTAGAEDVTAIVRTSMIEGSATGHLNLRTPTDRGSVLSVYSCSRI
jgi:hypothetical protein